jgi:hypothetical protein
MKTSGALSATALLSPTLTLLTPVIANLVDRAHSTRGTLLRDAPQYSLFMFPTLVLGSQSPTHLPPT